MQSLDQIWAIGSKVTRDHQQGRALDFKATKVDGQRRLVKLVLSHRTARTKQISEKITQNLHKNLQKDFKKNKKNHKKKKIETKASIIQLNR